MIVEAAWDQKPDLILAAGDMLSGEKEESDAVAVALLSRLVDLAPVCFTDGNHEMQVKKFCPERYKAFMEGLEKGGVQVLHNETWCTETGGQKVAVTGYELPWEYYRRFNRKHPSAEEIVKSIGTRQEDAYQILLTHNPVFFEEYARWGADFAFAGHLHGGFIRLPFLGGVISPQFQVFPKYDRGFISVERAIWWQEQGWEIILDVPHQQSARDDHCADQEVKPMGIAVKLQAFEGPLDLLLHLIEKNKVSIYDIPIAEITDQYMEYIHEMKKQDLGMMSEFLLMAATLLDIKSRMLLPKEVNEKGEEEDPRQELVQQLLEYKMYKYMSYELKERRQDAAQVLYHEPDLPQEVRSYRQPVSAEELLSGVTLVKMHQIFRDVMRRQNNRIDPVRSTFGTLKKEEVDLERTRQKVAQYIAQHEICDFRQILQGQTTKMQIIVTFLVILEMMKEGWLEIIQEEIFGNIRISRKKEFLPEEI